MIDTHRLGPMLRAARPIGRLLANGSMDLEAARSGLAAWACVAEVRGDWRGWFTQIGWALRGWQAHWERAAGRTQTDIVRALAPLLLTRRPSGELLEAAEAVNAQAGMPLRREQVRALVEREVAVALRRRRRGG